MLTPYQAATRHGVKILILLAMVAGALVPAPTLQRALRVLTGDASGPGGEYQLLVSMTYNGATTWEYKEDISTSEARRTESSPDMARGDIADRAKKALALREGYDPKVYGSESYKLLSGVRVDSIKLREYSSGRVTDVFVGGRSRNSENSLMD